MKIYKTIAIFSITILLQSCYKPGKIQIQNNISAVKIEDVNWGGVNLAYNLYPGETSDKTKLKRYDKKLPASHKVSFKMTANKKTVYLETEEEYYLDQDGDLLIILSDNTKVKNPYD